ncbi:hypothetical protein CFSAN002062_22839 [Salmonella enterica subsp. enterica serovar Heidelberg str. CFSAN002062]|nr:hypothetical protein CFSAN002062_22839 [Salmonella enterica subsp. enterica serovar Heidelberg str. CFSAN002062]
MTLTDVLIRVGYFFASNTSFNTKRPGFVPDRYLLKNRQLLSLRNPENGAIFCLRDGIRRKGE